MIIRHPSRLAALTLSTILSAAFAAADGGFGPHLYVGLDTQQTIPTGTYAGLADPNANRLTFLFGHTYPDDPSNNHYHAKGRYFYSGDPSSPTINSTSSGYVVPEGAFRVQLLPGSGALAGRQASGLIDAIYQDVTIRPTSALRNGSISDQALYNSSGGRYNGPLGAALIGLELVALSEGVQIHREDLSLSFDTPGQRIALGWGGFAYTPVFSVPLIPDNTMREYEATFRLVDMNQAPGYTPLLSGGEFTFRLQSAPVPEPATLATLGLGTLALIRRRRRG